ncbi:hypothetical protein Pelo_19274 [Pelomyxa schiedti]|nr:hypothetical protein Pelo_19274 [Pelomyxa schiedti]
MSWNCHSHILMRHGRQGHESSNNKRWEFSAKEAQHHIDTPSTSRNKCLPPLHDKTTAQRDHIAIVEFVAAATAAIGDINIDAVGVGSLSHGEQPPPPPAPGRGVARRAGPAAGPGRRGAASLRGREPRPIRRGRRHAHAGRVGDLLLGLGQPPPGLPAGPGHGPPRPRPRRPAAHRRRGGGRPGVPAAGRGRPVR